MTPMSMSRILSAVAVALAVSAANPGAASAATFSVNPTQLFLAGRTTSTLLTVRNDSKEPLRFQLSVFEWRQSATGEIELTPTSDVVFFPALLTLNAGEERRVRVGTTVTPGAVEKTYRIFVEELPPPADPDGGSGVRVLTKMGMPIFVRPAKESSAGTLGTVAMEQGAVNFSIRNTGTVHFVPEKITVRGKGADGQVVFQEDVAGWYILAGGHRDFSVALPAADCSRVSSIAVDVAFGQTALTESLQTKGACAQ
jgi:fimbrial chaperone protein